MPRVQCARAAPMLGRQSVVRSALAGSTSHVLESIIRMPVFNQRWAKSGRSESLDLCLIFQYKERF